MHGKAPVLRTVAHAASVIGFEFALRKVDKLAEGGHGGAEALATYWVGQVVGLMNAEQSVADVMLGFKTDFIEAHGRISALLRSRRCSKRVIFEKKV